MPVFVGLDLSLTSTGLSLNGNVETISSKQKGPERLKEIRNCLLERLSSIETNETIFVCLEGYSFASRNSQAHAIGELGGVIRLALWESEYPYVDIPPTSRAKFATGRGNASKNEVVSAISARTGIVWTGKGADDMCDAWILEEMGRAWFGCPRFKWPQISMSSLEGVDWSAFSD